MTEGARRGPSENLTLSLFILLIAASLSLKNFFAMPFRQHLDGYRYLTLMLLSRCVLLGAGDALCCLFLGTR